MDLLRKERENQCHRAEERLGEGRVAALRARPLSQGVLDEHGIDKCVIVGHSLGSTYATYFSRLRPERVVGTVLIDPICCLMHHFTGAEESCSTSPYLTTKLLTRARVCSFCTRRGRIYLVWLRSTSSGESFSPTWSSRATCAGMR